MQKSNQQKIIFKCPKCSNTNYELGQIRATGGLASKFFNIQNKKFISVTCTNCQYTEFYRRTTKGIENVFDFLIR